MGQESLKGYKIFKIVQLIVLIVFAIAFFCYLHFDPILKNNLYSNKNLLTICIFLWAFMIYSAISLFFDFIQIERNILDVHTLNEKAYLDRLTRLPNRNTVDLLIDNYRDRDISNTAGALITISNLNQINEQKGREAGDESILRFSKVFELTGNKYGFVGRNGGNEFLIVIDDCDSAKMQSFVNDLSKEIKNEFGSSEQGEMPIRISFSFAFNSEEKVSTMVELISRMYKETQTV